MDYEGVCEDLLEMEHKAGFYAARAASMERPNRIFEFVEFMTACQDFRHDLFLRGHGLGGY